MKKLPKQIVNIAFFVTMLGIVAYGIGYNKTRPKKVEEEKPVYSQCDNSNIAPWSNGYSWGEVLGRRL